MSSLGRTNGPWRRSDVTTDDETYYGFQCYFGELAFRNNPLRYDRDGVPSSHYCRGVIIRLVNNKGNDVDMYVLYKLSDVKLLGYVLNGGWIGGNDHVVIPVHVMAPTVDVLRMNQNEWNVHAADMCKCSIIAVDNVPRP